MVLRIALIHSRTLALPPVAWHDLVNGRMREHARLSSRRPNAPHITPWMSHEHHPSNSEQIESTRAELKSRLLPFSDLVESLPADYADRAALIEIVSALGTLLNPDHLEDRHSRLRMAELALSNATEKVSRMYRDNREASGEVT
jgi:hypothetical protein